MFSQTEDSNIKSAKKMHICEWCGEKISIGEPYIRYRFFNNGDAGTVKLHPECRNASRKLIEQERDVIYFIRGENARGHYCGGESECNCLENTKEI